MATNIYDSPAIRHTSAGNGLTLWRPYDLKSILLIPLALPYKAPSSCSPTARPCGQSHPGSSSKRAEGGLKACLSRGSLWTPPASSLASLGAFRPLPAPRRGDSRVFREPLFGWASALFARARVFQMASQGEPPAPAPGYQIAYGCEVAMASADGLPGGGGGGRGIICPTASGGGRFFPLRTRGHDAVRLPSGTRSLSLALCT